MCLVRLVVIFMVIYGFWSCVCRLSWCWVIVLIGWCLIIFCLIRVCCCWISLLMWLMRCLCLSIVNDFVGEVGCWLVFLGVYYFCGVIVCVGRWVVGGGLGI